MWRRGARKFRCGGEEINVVVNSFIMVKALRSKIHHSKSVVALTILSVVPKVGKKGLGYKREGEKAPLKGP